MNKEITKQACIDYIYGMEKEALGIDTAVNFIKGPGLDMAKKFVTSGAGKKILTGAGIGAASGLINPGAKTNSDGTTTQGSRIGSAVKGALTGGAVAGAGIAAKKYAPQIKSGLGQMMGGIQNQASEIVDNLFAEKLAEEDMLAQPNQSPNETSPKVPQTQPTLNPALTKKMNADMGLGE